MSSLLLQLPRRAVGLALLAAGGFAIAAPIVTGEWAVQLLSIPVFLIGAAEAYTAFRSADNWNKLSAYVPSLLALGARTGRPGAPNKPRRIVLPVIGKGAGRS